LKSKPYPKQFSKGRVLLQQLPQKMLQLLSDTKDSNELSQEIAKKKLRHAQLKYTSSLVAGTGTI